MPDASLPPRADEPGFAAPPPQAPVRVFVPSPSSGFAGPSPTEDALAWCDARGVWTDAALVDVADEALAIRGELTDPTDRRGIAIAVYERAKLAHGLLDLRRAGDELLAWAEQLAALATGVAWPAALAAQGRRAVDQVVARARLYRHQRGRVTPAGSRPPVADEVGKASPADLAKLKLEQALGMHRGHPLTIDEAAAIVGRQKARAAADVAGMAEAAVGAAQVARDLAHRLDDVAPARFEDVECRHCGRVYPEIADRRCAGLLFAGLDPDRKTAGARVVWIELGSNPGVLHEVLPAADECVHCRQPRAGLRGLFHYCPRCEAIACSGACWDAHVARPHLKPSGRTP